MGWLAMSCVQCLVTSSPCAQCPLQSVGMGGSSLDAGEARSSVDAGGRGSLEMSHVSSGRNVQPPNAAKGDKMVAKVGVHGLSVKAL